MRKVYPDIQDVLLVTGQPHICLAPQKSPAWKSLYESYEKIRREVVEKSKADFILYLSTQWLSVIGHLIQADTQPEWTYVDANWHDLGNLPYKFKVDSKFADLLKSKIQAKGYQASTVNYKGFPVDAGTIVAQKLLNPENRLPAGMMSCNIYAEKVEMVHLGQATAEALYESKKKAIVVLVSSLSHRYEVREIDPAKDKISSAKDHEWNLKICELLGEGRLEDVSQCAREFAKQANADMGFKGIWWLNAVCGESNEFKGKVFDYQPVWGTGNALVQLTPKQHVEVIIDETMKEVDEVANQAQPDQGSKPIKTKTKVAHSLFESQRAPEPVGPYPHARQVGDLLYLSGIGPRKRGTKQIPGVVMDTQGLVKSYDIETQTRSTIENVKSVLEDFGVGLDSVLDVEVFLADIKSDFQKFNSVYTEYFQNIRPTRTTVGVTGLPTPIAVELKVIARAPS